MVVNHSRFLARIFTVVLFCYCVAVGATFNGLLHPEFGLLTLVVMAALGAVWVYIRWRRNWQWHRTPLDGVIVLWVLAFVLSLMTNLDAERRILIGMWYMGLYIVVWYVLQDIIANDPQFREILVDGFLIAGVIVLVYGYIQVLVGVINVIQSGADAVIIRRPVSTFGNPNFLGNFLVVLIPFVLSRIVAACIRVRRAALLTYLALTLVLLLLSFSRGAWLSAVAGVSIWGWWLLTGSDTFSLRFAARGWFRQPVVWRMLLVVSALIGLLIILWVVVIFVGSFSNPVRSADSRTEIYQAALQLFLEKPITGQGLFTFGKEMVRLPEVHPVPHSHAHNIVLHVAAELGFAGLSALAVTILVIARSWKIAKRPDQVILAGAMAATAGFAVHQLFDVTAMMPVIMLSGMLALSLTFSPAVPRLSGVRRAYPLTLVMLWSILVFTGLWSNRIYARYASIITDVGRTGFYRQGAERLQAIIDADPLSLYRLEQAFLYGMAASIGDMDAARQGASAYEQFLALEPEYAFAWANLAGLYRQLGAGDQAITAMQEAERLDPDVWQYPANLALYLYDIGNTGEAYFAYQRALRLNPDARLYTELKMFSSDDSPDMSVPTRVGLMLAKGDVSGAAQLWGQNSLPDNVMNDVIQSMLAIAQFDLAPGQAWLVQAERAAQNRADWAWVHLGRARLAQALDKYDLMEHELEAARASVTRAALENDEILLLPISYAQFLRLPIPRQFLPQVFYPVDDALLLYLLERNE
jgi:putative inorganic carbon (HCO3(-)) transporter